jgi:hypothetical protein
MKLIERENEILRLVRRLGEEGLDFVIVGGYAVSALARHRFSVDRDIVVPREQMTGFERGLESEGFTRHVQRAGFDVVYGGEFVSYVKRVNGLPVTVDLLVGSLVCRATEASWSFEYIRKFSLVATIHGYGLSVECRIPERELLIAFKLHSARRADVRDFVMLRENAERSKVLAHLRRGDERKLKGQIDVVLKALEDKNLVDSLEGAFVMDTTVSKLIENAKKDLQNIVNGRKPPHLRH